MRKLITNLLIPILCLSLTLAVVTHVDHRSDVTVLDSTPVSLVQPTTPPDDEALDDTSDEPGGQDVAPVPAEGLSDHDQRYLESLLDEDRHAHAVVTKYLIGQITELDAKVDGLQSQVNCLVAHSGGDQSSVC